MRSTTDFCAIGWIVLFTCIPAGAAVWYVDDDAALGGDGTTWNTAFRYLKDALYVAQAGDQIWVAGGIYTPGRG